MNPWATKTPERPQRITKREIAAYTLLFILFVGGWIFVAFPTSGPKFFKQRVPEMMKCAFTEQCDNRKFWVSTHFILYVILGLLIPHRWILVGVTVTYWEIFERIVGSRLAWWNEGNFFYKSVYDIIADVVGYFLGSLLAQLLFSS